LDFRLAHHMLLLPWTQPIGTRASPNEINGVPTARFAHSVQAGGIRFFENGIMSLNLPVADEAIRARASRTTHPVALQLLKSLSSAGSLQTFTRSAWMTKRFRRFCGTTSDSR
jgi:hypothetical protein